MAQIVARALSGLPDVHAGDDVAALIVAALAEGGPDGGPPIALSDGQIVAIAHKVVSKAEGAIVALAGVRPGERALQLAAAQGKDPRLVQVVLEQSTEIVRAERGVLICRTHHGFVCANAGVDTSNVAEMPCSRSCGVSSEHTAGALSPSTPGARSHRVAGTPGADAVVVLPRDPDASARRLRARLRELTGVSVAVLITDSFGRAWRNGQCDVAIGLAGMQPLDDWRGRADAAGRQLRATWLAVADSVAAAADLARAKDSGEPVVMIDGLERFVTDDDGPGAAALVRPIEEDLFR